MRAMRTACRWRESVGRPPEVSQEALRIDVDGDANPPARRRRGGQHRAQETLQIGRPRRLGGETEPVPFAQDRDRRFRRTEQDDLVVARLPAERRDTPAFPWREAMGGAGE